MIPEFQDDDNVAAGLNWTPKSSVPEDPAPERFWSPWEIARLRQREPTAELSDQRMPHEKFG
jgi:hypothetical protein